MASSTIRREPFPPGKPQARLDHPIPSGSLDDMVNGGFFDTIPPTKFGHRDNPLQGSDLPDILLSKDRTVGLFPTIARAVENFVLLVLSMCRPTKVSWIDTAMGPPPARMRGLMGRRRRWSVGYFAHDPRRYPLLSLVPNSAVASSLVYLKRPRETFRAIVACIGFNPPQRCIHFGAAAQRVAVSPPAPVVLLAEAVRPMLCIAAWDGTCTNEVSHGEPPVLSRSEPVAALERSAGSLFVPFLRPKIQQEQSMIIRIVTGIKTHFEARFVEWVMGGTAVWYGLKLVGEETAWTNAAAWENMTSLRPENQWGWICISLGLARLLALAINGTFADTAYSRYSPVVRGLTAIVGAWFWLMAFMSVSASSGSGGGIYQLPLILDVWCVFHAWRDVGRARAARDGTV